MVVPLPWSERRWGGEPGEGRRARVGAEGDREHRHRLYWAHNLEATNSLFLAPTTHSERVMVAAPCLFAHLPSLFVMMRNMDDSQKLASEIMTKKLRKRAAFATRSLQTLLPNC